MRLARALENLPCKGSPPRIVRNENGRAGRSVDNLAGEDLSPDSSERRHAAVTDAQRSAPVEEVLFRAEDGSSRVGGPGRLPASQLWDGG